MKKMHKIDYVYICSEILSYGLHIHMLVTIFQFCLIFNLHFYYFLVTCTENCGDNPTNFPKSRSYGSRSNWETIQSRSDGMVPKNLGNTRVCVFSTPGPAIVPHFTHSPLTFLHAYQPYYLRFHLHSFHYIFNMFMRFRDLWCRSGSLPKFGVKAMSHCDERWDCLDTCFHSNL